MSSEKFRTISLLKFYKDNNQEIEIVMERGKVVGKVTKCPNVFSPEVIMKTKNGNKVKLFLDDIPPNSIFPLDVFENKGDKPSWQRN